MDMGKPLQRLTKRRTIRLFVDMDKGLIFCPPWLLSPQASNMLRVRMAEYQVRNLHFFTPFFTVFPHGALLL